MEESGARFGLKGLGSGISSANKPALVKAGRQANDFGEPDIRPHSNPFPQRELAQIGDRGRGQKCRTSSMGKRVPGA
jgi:hypothetical protein